MSSSPYEPGRIVAHYELVSRIGRGGMGEVWRAEHVETRELAALKILFHRPDRREEAAERFEREVAAAARIGHPGAVRVRAYGTDEVTGAMYLVMELLVGTHLRGWLERGPRDARSAVELVREVLEPLAAAHACTEEGRPAPIIHRDLKPENVFVLDGTPARTKLLDFGIARQSGSDQTVTDTGVGMGTAAYMSPEQATDARNAGPASDVWSVGAMLYEILAGRGPFEAPSKNEVISKILTTDPFPLRELAPEVPRTLSKLVMACLAKDPSRRPRDARALANALDVILADRDAAAALASYELQKREARAAAPGAFASTLAAGPTTRSTEARTGWRARALVALGILGALGVGVIALALPPDRERPITRPRQPEIDAGAIPRAEALNRWIRVEPADVVLGVAELGAGESAFLHAVGVRAPDRTFEIQQHEVTYGEMDAWAARVTGPGEEPPFVVLVQQLPPWVPRDAEERRRFPMVAPWELARRYCTSLGADLPTEEQWEHAARGAPPRPYAWGDAVPDPDRTNIGPSPRAHEAPVMTNDQDRTPGAEEDAIFDLMGNLREWTLDLWRGNETGRVDAWAHAEGRTYRAVRGLPLIRPSPLLPPSTAPAAYRMSLCATGACPEGTDELRAEIGFRCAR